MLFFSSNNASYIAETYNKAKHYGKRVCKIKHRCKWYPIIIRSCWLHPSCFSFKKRINEYFQQREAQKTKSRLHFVTQWCLHINTHSLSFHFFSESIHKNMHFGSPISWWSFSKPVISDFWPTLKTPYNPLLWMRNVNSKTMW